MEVENAMRQYASKRRILSRKKRRRNINHMIVCLPREERVTKYKRHHAIKTARNKKWEEFM